MKTGRNCLRIDGGGLQAMTISCFDLLANMNAHSYRLSAKTFKGDNKLEFDSTTLTEIRNVVITVDLESRMCKGMHFDERLCLLDVVSLGDAKEFTLYAKSYFDAAKEFMCHTPRDVLVYYHGVNEKVVVGPLSLANRDWCTSENIRLATTSKTMDRSAFVNAQSGIASFDLSGRVWFGSEAVPKNFFSKTLARVSAWYNEDDAYI